MRLIRLARLCGMLAALAALAGCAPLSPSPPLPAMPAMPLLRLAPSSLGREWAVVQQLDVQAGGQKRSFEVALEVDARSVRVACMQWGHTVARLDWDGRQLDQSLAPGWPDAVSAERVLSDLQLVWWPAAAVRAALAPGWLLTESAQTRELSYGGRTVASVRMLAPGHIELRQHAQGYTVQVHTRGDAAPVFSTP
ncbi:DUF3261 domain-containing protein [Verminephrobacter aporrectodeae subsp. tuberculatae]|nr:DUF3261 domain-containing protein [Verminephrobacter aporrectodeae subsp. tuberculatae]MCW5289333.1 DUF3261 domain-containing protein [Verminephrobacter aporrectodeae subsp. tuberculatae]